MKGSHGAIPVTRGESEGEGKAWGHGQHANMPQDVHMQEMAGTPHFMEEKIDDTARRIDEDSKQSIKGERKGYNRGMY